MNKGRRRLLSVLVVSAFAAAAGSVYVAAVGEGGEDAPNKRDNANEELLPVVVERVERRHFEDVLEVQGNVAAKNFALVPSIIGGTIRAFYVEEGDAVVAGETELFKVDDLKLQKAVEVRTHEVAVARCALREKEALQDEIAAGLEKVKMDLARLEKLYRDEAIPLDRLEQQQTRYRQAEAKMDHAESLVSLAGEQVRQAEASLAMAQKDLADTVTVAPVSGMVSGKYFELGEMAESGKPVLRIDDGSLIEVSAFLPAESYPRIQTGGTAARIMVYGHDAGQHVVSYKAPRIHSTLRTFEVRWLIEDPAEGVAPGAMAEIGVVLRERDGLGVPADAIQLRRSGPVVFTVAKGTAHRHDVRTGIESGGWTELMGAPFEEGTSVVTMGQSQLEEGAAVEVRTSGETDSGV